MTMAELLPSTSKKKPTDQKLGLGLLIDPITSSDPNVQIRHTEPHLEEGAAATDEEVGLLRALERDFYQLTIEQAEIETGRERPGAVDEAEMKLDVVCEEKGGENADRFEDENESVRGYLENEGTSEPDSLQEEKVGKNEEVGGEDENVDRWGYVENEETVKLDNLGEEKGENNAESVEYQIETGWPRMENEETMKLDIVHESEGGKYAESVEDEKNRWCYMDNVGVNEENVWGKARDAVTKFGRSNQSNYSKWVNYPMRPDADDCTFYMRFGSCKFGENCKFNHPPRRKNQGAKERAYPSEENSERAEQTECKYYLTSAGCRYGKDCKYSHDSDKSSMFHRSLEFNFLGLPIRPEEIECSYYMRTGTCKYGSNCRFHHPEPTTVADADSPSGYVNGDSIPRQPVSSSSWSSPSTFHEASSFTPVMFSPAQGAPHSDLDWNSSQFEAATYPTSERSLPTPPAFSLNNLPTAMNFPMQHQHGRHLEAYPERMGEPECDFFMKTGDCKFKYNCKFHHPKNHILKARSNQFTLNDKGLPLRPDQPICTHYHRYGICKFGPACKYDHPSRSGNLPTSFDHQPAF